MNQLTYVSMHPIMFAFQNVHLCLFRCGQNMAFCPIFNYWKILIYFEVTEWDSDSQYTKPTSKYTIGNSCYTFMLWIQWISWLSCVWWHNSNAEWFYIVSPYPSDAVFQADWMKMRWGGWDRWVDEVDPRLWWFLLTRARKNTTHMNP